MTCAPRSKMAGKTKDASLDDPEFREYLIPNAKLTGARLGSGGLEEVEVAGAACVTRKICDGAFPTGETMSLKIKLKRLAERCKLLNTLRHPNIVQFIGVYASTDLQLPALVVEALDTSLHRFLDPESARAKPSIPLSFKISILHNVACGLAYLHSHSPPFAHCHLSAKRVLLDSAMVAKISMDMAVLTPHMVLSIYMPPEVSAGTGSTLMCKETIDIFSFGVLAMFTLTEELPDNLLPATHTNEAKELVARSELERRAAHMEKIYSQLRRSHPLVKMIEQCLSNLPKARPSVEQALVLLRQARAETPAPLLQQSKRQLVMEVASKSNEILQLQSTLESRTAELTSQMKGLLQGMARLRNQLSGKGEGSTKSEGRVANTVVEMSKSVEEEHIPYVLNFLEGIRASDLGQMLCIPAHKLQTIEYDCPHDEGKRRYEVLTEWVRNSDDATWSALVEALSAVGQQRTAQTISTKQGLSLMTDITAESAVLAHEAEREEKPEKPQVEGRDDTSMLESQLQQAKQEVESVRTDLRKMEEELAQVREKSASHEKELEGKAKEIKLLKRELDAEVKVREEAAKENAKLEIELVGLKGRHEREVKAKTKEINQLQKQLMQYQSSSSKEKKAK